jgi:uncharacterized protein (TIGR00255 family)
MCDLVQENAMPVYSMTGFGSATHGLGSNGSSGDGVGAVTVDLRSVNGRFLDLTLRLPDEFRSLEPTLREIVAGSVKRGKIELRLNTQRDATAAWPQPSPEQLHRLARLESTVQGWMPNAPALSVHEVLQWCRAATPAAVPGDAAIAAARDAVAAMAEAREREGARLAEVLRERTAHLRALALRAAPLLPAVVQRQQARFLERWQEALAQVGAAGSVPQEALQERALNEAAAFALRIDVAEELARLRAHLDEIDRLLDQGGELGKRLDFLIQELHREANTLGSKSAALELTGISVEMKVAIEQMREQVQNIE